MVGASSWIFGVWAAARGRGGDGGFDWRALLPGAVSPPDAPPPPPLTARPGTPFPLRRLGGDVSGGGGVMGWLPSLLGAGPAALVAAFAVQGGVKHLLTEGDSLLLLRIASREQRGAYALVCNYGSLVARVLFAPLEEAARVALAKLGGGEAAAAEGSASLARGDPDGGGGGGVAVGTHPAIETTVDRGESTALRKRRAGRGRSRSPSRSAVDGTPSRPPLSGSLRASPLLPPLSAPAPTPSPLAARRRALYFNVRRVVVTVGVLCAALGPPFAGSPSPLVPLLLGRQWGGASGVPDGLAAYAVYLLFLAVNGVTEGFVSAVGDAAFLMRYNAVLAAACGASLAATAALMPVYGLGGLVAANCVGMAVRIGAGVWFIVGTGGHTSADSRGDAGVKGECGGSGGMGGGGGAAGGDVICNEAGVGMAALLAVVWVGREVMLITSVETLPSWPPPVPPLPRGRSLMSVVAQGAAAIAAAAPAALRLVLVTPVSQLTPPRHQPLPPPPRLWATSLPPLRPPPNGQPGAPPCPARPCWRPAGSCPPLPLAWRPC